MHTNLTKDYFKASLSLGHWASTRFTEERKWMILKLSIWFESVQRGDFFFFLVNIHMDMRIFNSELLWNVYPYNTFKSFFSILLNPNSLQCGIRFCIPYIRTSITLDICLLQRIYEILVPFIPLTVEMLKGTQNFPLGRYINN